MLSFLNVLHRPTRPSRRHMAAMMFGEALESRTLLSGNVDATIDDGTLSLKGDSDDNSIEVTIVGDDLVVRGLSGTTINDSSDPFVITEGNASFGGDIKLRLGAGRDTFRLNGELTVEGDISSFDYSGRSEFAITDALVEGDVRIHSNNQTDTVSLVNAAIDGGLQLDLQNGRAFVSLLDSTVLGAMDVHTGNRNDVILLEGSTVGGLDARTGSWRDDIIIRDSTINGDFHASTGGDRDYVLVEDSTVTGETQLWLWWDSDVVVTQGTVDFEGDFLAGGILGRHDTIDLSDDTNIGGQSHIIGFENRSHGNLDGINARIERRIAEAQEFRALLNNLDLGDLTLTVDTSSNPDLIPSNGTLITKADTLTIEGMTLAGSTVSVTAGDGGMIDLGSVVAGADGSYSIEVDLLLGPTTLTVTATDILDRTISQQISLHVAAGTVVRFDSSEGSFDVELYDDAAPQTVANFLNYADRYIDSIVHRKATDATAGVDVIQGGGYSLNANDVLQEIPTDVPVTGEPGSDRSNVRGTLAMALVGNPPNPNSGTSQFYINVNDNTNLDPLQFTVFGEVIGDGLDVVDAIFALDAFDINDVVPAGNGALGSVPLEDYVLDEVQLTGTVSTTAGSIAVTGNGTLFTTELDINDRFFVSGEEFRVASIESSTSLTLTSPANMSFSDAAFMTPPIATAAPTREQYVVFNSIGVLLP